ncbi:hypothetical protein Droror1_Dr00028184, partial [Drosera rotundifolia]
MNARNYSTKMTSICGLCRHRLAALPSHRRRHLRRHPHPLGLPLVILSRFRATHPPIILLLLGSILHSPSISPFKLDIGEDDRNEEKKTTGTRTRRRP